MCKDRIILKTAAFFILAALMGYAVSCTTAFGAEADEKLPYTNSGTEWDSMESDYFTIYYKPDAGLQAIERELKKRPLYFEQLARQDGLTPSQEVCQRLDMLCDRASDVLGMHTKMPKITIKIFKDRSELDEKCVEVFGEVKDLRSFYVYEENTIYTSEDDIEDSVMIHEMAHAIIDHYFAVVPPESVGEILASYVDAHLEE